MNNIKTLINLALIEDALVGDITSNATIDKNAYGNAVIRAKEDIVVSGADIAACVFEEVDKKIKVKIISHDGTKIKKGTVIIKASGPVRSLLTAERTALNFMQHLSGIATLTAKFVDSVKGTKVKILDTRKTTPGWRILEKYAVRCGDGYNHRVGLYDMYLIKNNHVDAAGSVTEAIHCVKQHRVEGTPVEVEVRNFDELGEAVAGGVDIIMLDNFTVANAKKAAINVQKLCKKLGIADNNRPKIEISGNITLKTVRTYSKTGADFISVGAITHSAPAVDIHMRISL